jgi:hypothetical protein
MQLCCARPVLTDGASFIAQQWRITTTTMAHHNTNNGASFIAHNNGASFIALRNLHLQLR